MLLRLIPTFFPLLTGHDPSCAMGAVGKKNDSVGTNLFMGI